MGSDQTVLPPILCLCFVGYRRSWRGRMLYRLYESVRIRYPNSLLDSICSVWRATEYDLGNSSVPRWHASMRAARRQGVLEVVRCRTGSSPRVRARAPPVHHLLCGGYKCDLHTRFKANKDIMDALVQLRKKRGAGGRGEATAGEPVLA